MSILNEIVARKKVEVIERKSLYPNKLLEQSLYFDTPTVSFSKYISEPERSGIIAEFKRKSPSKGPINSYAQVEEITIGYMQAGASALSVLTDQKFFGGKNEDLSEARNFNYCPILRKDFIVDEYQIIEAKSIGADAILLIAEILTHEEVQNFSSFANSLGLEVLLEMHGESQIDKISEFVNVVGVNNRDLTTFETTIQTSKQLASKLPSEIVKISESGISKPESVIELKSHGYQGFLIGEYFMQHASPHKICRNFIKAIEQESSK